MHIWIFENTVGDLVFQVKIILNGNPQNKQNHIADYLNGLKF